MLGVKINKGQDDTDGPITHPKHYKMIQMVSNTSQALKCIIRYMASIRRKTFRCNNYAI